MKHITNTSCRGGKQIEADIRGAVYLTVRQNGKEETYRQLMDLFKKTDLHEERERVQRILGTG